MKYFWYCFPKQNCYFWTHKDEKRTTGSNNKAFEKDHLTVAPTVFNFQLFSHYLQKRSHVTIIVSLVEYEAAK